MFHVNLYNKRACPTKKEPQQGFLYPTIKSLKCLRPRNLRAMQKPHPQQEFCFYFIIF
jgi:hypothetical protein